MNTQQTLFEIDGFDWSKVNIFLDALLKIESASDFCKAVVHSGFSGGFVNGCHLYRLGTDAAMTATAGYGMTFDHLAETFSIWDENPVSAAVRNKASKFIAGTKASRPMIVVPLVKGNSPIGAVTLVLDENITENPIDENLVPVLERISGYWLASIDSPILNKINVSVSADGRNLTSRQLKILSFMADGLVNAEIAAHLVVSESTVRQETVRIYRELGVANRAEASRKARLLGLIKGTSPAA